MLICWYVDMMICCAIANSQFSIFNLISLQLSTFNLTQPAPCLFLPLCTSNRGICRSVIGKRWGKERQRMGKEREPNLLICWYVDMMICWYVASSINLSTYQRTTINHVASRINLSTYQRTMICRDRDVDKMPKGILRWHKQTKKEKLIETSA